MVNTPLLQLFEDLCREGDRMYEESTQDREDLQLQVNTVFLFSILHARAFY